VPKVPKVPTDAETCLDKMFDKWGQ
jgi:hypothetical protein